MFNKCLGHEGDNGEEREGGGAGTDKGLANQESESESESSQRLTSP